MSEAQPLINRKIAIRAGIGVAAIVVLLGGYLFLKKRGEDLDLGAANTVGWIAAIETQPQGQKLVLLKPDGTIEDCPGWEAPAYDRSFAWRPDGNRIFLASDRGKDSSNIYRWNLATDVVMLRTLGKIPRTDPMFPVGEDQANVTSPLIISGGIVRELDPATGMSKQVYPPSTDKNEGERDERSNDTTTVGGNGAGGVEKIRSMMEFKSGHYLAFIRNMDEGQLLMIYDLTAKDSAAIPVAMGDTVQMTVSPKTGALVFAVRGNKVPSGTRVPPEMIKNGKVKMPYRNAICYFDPEVKDEGAVVLVASSNDVAFADPAISPDGLRMLMVAGKVDSSDEFHGAELVTISAEPRTPQNPQLLARNVEVSSPCWRPDGRKVAYIAKLPTQRAIFEADVDGGNAKNLTPGKGSFTKIAYSPQK